MTKANDLASLLDANGDVVSSALDNVPASDLVNDTTPQLGGTLDTNTNDINFGTNVKSNYGTSAQLMMYHDGSNGWIKGNNTGNNSIAIQSGGTGSVMISGSSGQNIISQQGDAAYLHHAGFAKLITTASGCDVTGDITATHLKIGTTANPSAGGVRVVTNTAGGSFAQYSDSQTNSGFTLGTIAGSGIFYTHTGAVGSETYVERMRLSSGNLLVGKTILEYSSNTGHVLRNDGLLSAVRSGGNVVNLNRLSSDGEIIQLNKDGTRIGSIGTLAGFLTVGTGDTGILFQSNVDNIQPINLNTNSDRDNAIDIGDDENRFKDLYLGGGVYLGGTAAANKLDDYEEGTFTPTFARSSTAPVYGTSVASGFYRKIGSVVHIQILIVVTSVTTSGSGNLLVSGLPFVGAVQSYSGVLNVGYNDTFDAAIKDCYVTGTSLQMIPTGVTQSNYGGVLSTGYCSITGTYITT